jgi:hypothetical protein
MTNESTTPKLDAALAEAKARLKGVPFDQHGAYNQYASINQVREIVNPILADAGITFRCIKQSMLSEVSGVGVILVRVFRCSHKSGEYETVKIEWPVAKGRNLQEDVGKCSTYLTRYVYRDYFELPLGREPDYDDAPVVSEEDVKIEVEQSNLQAEARMLYDQLRPDDRKSHAGFDLLVAAEEKGKLSGFIAYARLTIEDYSKQEDASPPEQQPPASETVRPPTSNELFENMQREAVNVFGGDPA